jgi:hypothetical protein
MRFRSCALAGAQLPAIAARRRLVHRRQSRSEKRRRACRAAFIA